MAGGKAWHVLRMPPRRVGGVHRVLHALAGWSDLNGQGSIRDGERIGSQTKITRVHKNYICATHAKAARQRGVPAVKEFGTAALPFANLGTPSQWAVEGFIKVQLQMKRRRSQWDRI